MVRKWYNWMSVTFFLFFKRREIPDEFGKKYVGTSRNVSFIVKKLTGDLINRFPIENFDFTERSISLKLDVKSNEEVESILKKFSNLELDRNN